jgi:hypothetical protein
MASRVRPTRAEFEIGQNEVVHMPTNATWTAYPGRAEAKSFRPSRLGTVLPSGADYDVDEVKALAMKLLAERPIAKERQ